MRLTNKQTGISFNLNPKQTADFFYMKDDKGEYINQFEEYIIQDTCKEISTFKFFLCIIGIISLGYASFYLFLQFNY